MTISTSRQRRLLHAVCCAVFVFAGMPVSAKPIGDPQVQLNVGLDTPVMLAGKKDKAYLKIGLTGYTLQNRGDRAAVNVAIVLDQSGSMNGQKIQKAKEAAKMAVNLLRKDDIVSIIAYSDHVQVVVPSTKVQDKDAVIRAIDRLRAVGSTALFAGVSKGAKELQKFIEKERVNRIILLSDGLANVGPSSPAELGDLGSALAKMGISVSTIGLGLGYNEDLMVQLAMRSDGNHAFVENARDLARIFENEFNDVLSVVAQDVHIEIRCRDGVKPMRVLGRDAEIIGDKVVAKLNQLYSDQEKYVLLEVEVPATAPKHKRQVADIHVQYTDMMQGKHKQLTDDVQVAFSQSAATVTKRINRGIKGAAVEQISADRNTQALQLRDKGKVDEARKLLLDNAAYLRQNAELVPEQKSKFKALEKYNKEAAGGLDKKTWSRTRKSLRKKTYEIESQQSY